MNKPKFNPGQTVIVMIVNRLWRFYFMTLVGLFTTYWFAAIIQEQSWMSLFSVSLWDALFRGALMLGCLSWMVMVFESIRDR